MMQKQSKALAAPAGHLEGTFRARKALLSALLCAAASSTGCALQGGELEGDDPLVVDVEDERVRVQSWEEYRSRAVLKDDGVLIAEHDLMFPNEDALRAHYEGMVSEAEEEKLVVIRRQSTGFEPTFTNAEQTDLTYCVSNSFANKSTVVSHMAAATKSWEDVARLRFVYLPGQDSTCDQNNSNVLFAVMPTTVGGLLGCAGNKKLWSGMLSWWGCQVAPGAPFIKGVLLLNYGASLAGWPGVTRTGIIRHELGHMLGFRHEHPWDPTPACGEPQSAAAPTDVTGRQLTAYDKSSVMHYPTCDGISGVDLVLSPLDGDGSRSVYGMPASWYVPLGLE